MHYTYIPAYRPHASVVGHADWLARALPSFWDQAVAWPYGLRSSDLRASSAFDGLSKALEALRSELRRRYGHPYQAHGRRLARVADNLKRCL